MELRDMQTKMSTPVVVTSSTKPPTFTLKARHPTAISQITALLASFTQQKSTGWSSPFVSSEFVRWRASPDVDRLAHPSPNTLLCAFSSATARRRYRMNMYAAWNRVSGEVDSWS